MGKISQTGHVMEDNELLYTVFDGKHADAAIQEFIGNHRMEKLHTGGHAYVETVEKLIQNMIL